MISLNKSKIIVNITIGLMSFILIYVMFIQFRTINETNAEEIEVMRETELRSTLATYKTNCEEVETELKTVQDKINEYNKNEASEEKTVSLLEEELLDANMRLRKNRCNRRRHYNYYRKYRRK